MSSLRAVALSFALLAATATPAAAQKPEVLAGTAQQTGLLPVHVDAKQGRILLSLPAPDATGLMGRYIYVTALKTGLGSAPIGLDRALSGGSKLVVFRRLGKKVLLEAENPRFRATNAPPPEQAAARDSFRVFDIVDRRCRRGDGDGRVLVDLASLLTQDMMGIGQALKSANEKGFALSKELSVADPNSVKAFPDNLELEARQTFVSAEPSAEINNIAPATGNLSFVVRHSFVRLPAPGYQPRRFDPRTGVFSTQVLDYAAPLGSPIVYDVANRFRLEKVDPSAPRSRVKKPILFYIDTSAPEPIRTALFEGASWWRRPSKRPASSTHIAWRCCRPASTRSISATMSSTGPIGRRAAGPTARCRGPAHRRDHQGQVLLGSLRVRQDMLIFEGWSAPTRSAAAARTIRSPPPSRACASFPRMRSATRSASRTISPAPSRPLLGAGLSRAAHRARRWRA
jgi:hypothetical protein